MVAKILSGMQYCCCNLPPTYIGERGSWTALCLRCKRAVGPFKTATEAKKHWNKIMKIQHKEWIEAVRGK